MVTASDRGAGAVLALAIVGMLAAVMLSLVPVIAVLGATGKARSAADVAALAAADAAIGLSSGVPCDEAARVAAANGATVSACLIDGVVVSVEVTVRTGVAQARATATAGPP